MTDVTPAHRILHRFRVLQAVGRSSAHELRNIAQTMQMSSDVLRGVPEADVSIPSMLDEGSYRLLDLTDRLARWSSAARSPEPAALAQVMGVLPPLLHSHPARERLTYACTIANDFPLVRVVPEQLLEAVWAVVVNAMEAAQDGTKVRVTVAAEQRGEVAELTIEDDGAGVPAEVVPTLFTVREAMPAGLPRLGLAVARTLLRDLGGELEYRPSGHGARFVVTIPLWQRGTSAS